MMVASTDQRMVAGCLRERRIAFWPWLDGLAAMPEVLPVPFKQTLCSNGVKLLLDLAVADECDGDHE